MIGERKDYSGWNRLNRTIFNYVKNNKTTFNVGDLAPVNWEECVPGDTYNIQKIDILTRLISPSVVPTLQNLYLELHHFFVPNRLTNVFWRRTMGEVNDWDTAEEDKYNIYKLKFQKSSSIDTKIHNYSSSILAYLGVPLPTDDDIAQQRHLPDISKTLINSYALIWNNFFRDQNLEDQKYINIVNQDIYFTAEDDPNSDFHASAPNFYTGKLAKVNKNLDYFTDTYIDTQKGQQVKISLGDLAPVITSSTKIPKAGSSALFLYNSDTQNVNTPPTTGLPAIAGVQLRNYTDHPVPTGVAHGMAPSNLWADLNNSSVISINDIREAQKIQKEREKDLVSGTRYFEILKSYFGINSDLGELDVPVHISSSRHNIEISQVVQTSATQNSPTELGSIGGYSVKGGMLPGVNYQAKEHGILMTIACVKYDHMYPQGLHKHFTRFGKNDFFNPNWLGLGYQPVYLREIYGHLPESEYSSIFGFTRAWERERVWTNTLTGQLNPFSRDSQGNLNGLTGWTFADIMDYWNTLNKDWKKENKDNVDNTLHITSELTNQVLLDINFSGKCIKLVDALGVPGLGM